MDEETRLQYAAVHSTMSYEELIRLSCPSNFNLEQDCQTRFDLFGRHYQKCKACWGKIAKSQTGRFVNYNKE